MKILSLFDGMACGMLAMLGAGVDVESYDAYEIDKYAITLAKHNFPKIQQHGADGKIYDVFEVADGKITIKAKAYPIKLLDGYYIIRKFTVRECARLQTVPEWYDFSVISNTQAYKCLGNGWTVEVIIHLIKSCLTGLTEKTYKQVSIFD